MKHLNFLNRARAQPIQLVGRTTDTSLLLRTVMPEQRIDREFREMHCGFCPHGGTGTSNELARRMQRHAEQPSSVLARWIAARTIVSFVWQSQLLIPLFQFDPCDMSPRATVQAVTRELVTAFDDWELAHWFVHPNNWLHNACPVDEIAINPHEVVQAARADRFIALG